MYFFAVSESAPTDESTSQDQIEARYVDFLLKIQHKLS